MALTIPNESAAPADAQQATLYQADIDAIVAGIAGDGVISGCAVSAQGSPDNTVAVAAGSVLIGGAVVSVSSGNVTMPTADGTHPMWVLISVSNAGTKTATAGTAAASPLLPAIPANHVALAAVWWPASDTTVAGSQITDKRALLGFISTSQTRSANTVLAGPASGSAAAPTFRALDPADMPARSPTRIELLEDFFYGNGGMSTGTNGTGSGVTVNSSSMSDPGGHPGWAVCTTGTTTSGRAGFYTFNTGLTLGNGSWATECIVRIPTLSDATDNYSLVMGFGDNSGLQNGGVDVVAFRYNYNVLSGNWQCACRSNDNESGSTADSGVAVVANTNYKLRIEISADASSAQFFVNGSSVATITSNIPSGTSRRVNPMYVIQKLAGTNSRDMYLDYIYLRNDLTTAR